ncbi:hypothetical protein C7S18_09250 [Ahniella affigens]|uniref:RDD family protein n=1 Tax=Ahniella affigens TaxID=2021234 RepID=A0A2P1PRB7_9GAMM|nr:RDD family protein [Ahniella affigens]AVP97368.1 hypothetical protein C7S18_09250 [Ahniella affigens]
MKDTWYVCDPDWDDALGPMSRSQLDRLIAQRKLSSSCLAWHADLAEWRPLYGSLGGSTSNAANAAADAASGAQASPKTQEQIAQTSKAQRKAQLQAQQEAQQVVQANKTADSARERANKQRQAQRKQAPPQTAQPAASDADKAKEQAANAAFSVLTLRRLGARVIDYLLVMPILLAALFALLQQQFGFWPGRTAGELDPNGLVWLGFVLAVPAEAIMLAFFGTTIGKALFGLQVRNHRNEKPNLSVAFGRQTSVFVRGMALGIPVLSFIAILVAAIQTLSAKVAPWDQRRGLRVLDAGGQGGIRPKLAIAAVIAALYFFVNDSVLEVVANFQQMLGAGTLMIEPG